MLSSGLRSFWLSGELDRKKRCGSQMPEKAVPCRNLATKETSGAKAAEKNRALQGLWEQAASLAAY